MKKLIINLLMCVPLMTSAQLWKSVGPIPGPAFSSIHAIAGYNGEVVVGGEFDWTTNCPFDRVARWTGTEWKNVGGGIHDWTSIDFPTATVYQLINYKGELIAGGSFWDVGLSYLIKWDGNSWKKFNDSVSWTSPVFNLVIKNNLLYVSGAAVGISDGITIQNVSAGILMGSGVLDDEKDGVICSNFFSGEIHAGGAFTFNNELKHIAKFNGISWQPLPIDATAQINFLEDYKGYLYAAGGIIEDPNGGIPLGYFFKKWDGTQWHEIMGLQNHVNVTAMTIYGDKLFISAGIGDSLLGGNSIKGIFAYDGLQWDTLAIMNGVAYAFGIVNDTLYAGGAFSELDGQPCSSLLKFTEVSHSTAISSSFMAQISLYPNPTSATVSIEIPFSYKEAEIRITNILGVEVKNEKFYNTPINITMETLPADVYFVNVTVDSVNHTRKIIKN